MLKYHKYWVNRDIIFLYNYHMLAAITRRMLKYLKDSSKALEWLKHI